MAEDKRIRKTKRNLKEALLTLLSQKPFEQITVRDICEASDTSRITFYAHYDDKFALLDELFQDFSELAATNFEQLQQQTNPERSTTASYYNLLDSILDFYFQYVDTFETERTGENPYLRFLIYKYILKNVERLVEAESEALQPKYSLKKTTWFLCYGLWGFINEARAEGDDLEQIRQETHGLLLALLQSDVFVSHPPQYKPERPESNHRN